MSIGSSDATYAISTPLGVNGQVESGASATSKAKSKDRRGFTAAEDAALRAGYLAHGTAWARIARDPVFSAAHGGLGRRSTDLRDRFRNAWPKDYEREGYKPRRRNKRPTGRKTHNSTGSSVSSSGFRGRSPDVSANLSMQNRSDRIPANNGVTSPLAMRGGGRSVDFNSATGYLPYAPGQSYPSGNWSSAVPGGSGGSSWQSGGAYQDSANSGFSSLTNHTGTDAQQDTGSGTSSAIAQWYNNPDTASNFGLYQPAHGMTASASGTNAGSYSHPHYTQQQSPQRQYQHQSNSHVAFPALPESSFHLANPGSGNGGNISSYYPSQFYPATDSDVSAQAAGIKAESRHNSDFPGLHSATSGNTAYSAVHGYSSFAQSNQRSRGSSTSKITNDSSGRGGGASSTFNGGSNVGNGAHSIAPRWDDRSLQ